MWRALRTVISRRFLFNLLAFLLIGLICYGLLKEPHWDSVQFGWAVAAALLGALVGNFEHLDFIKASVIGIEAKTKAVVERAENAVNELHALAELAGTLIVSLIAGEGRWGGMDRAGKMEQKANLLSSLKSLGLTNAALKRVREADRSYVIVDYTQHIVEGLRKMVMSRGPTINSKDPNEPINRLRDYTNKYLAGFDRPDAQALLEFANSLGSADSETLEWIEDYRYYLATGEHRRPEKWRSGVT